MFYENKNTTYNKVFQSIENTQSSIYYSLPENSLKDKIYKLRLTNGLTQKEFAIKTGVSYSAICRYETGYNISVANKEKICKALNIPLNYFDL